MWCVWMWAIALAAGVEAGEFSLSARARERTGTGPDDWMVVERTVKWDAAKTAVVVCDMWDKHHCPDATERVGEMAPRMNQVLRAARARGALIIHCPSDTMDFYKDHPGRRLAQAAPKIATTIPLENWCPLQPDREAPLPIDDSDGGCDGCPDCPGFKAWTRQHPALDILPGDAITDSAEAYYLMRERGITNVIVMGVHVNMCVLGRPFSIRQMARQGQNVVLMRDLTDSMYNHRKAPYVSHFRGTELVVEHIEKYWCPSVTSADVLGGEPFRFAADRPKEICFIIGENEYRTWETLPEFARKELAWRGYRLSFVTASEQVGDNDFRNWEAIPRADVLVVSVRRRAPPRPMLEAVRAHLAAGKPLVGLRTASHAFEQRNQREPTDTSWMGFDEEVLGGDYLDHYGAGPETIVRKIPETSGHPILNNVAAEFRSPSSLYRNRRLANTVTPLLNGRTADDKSETEPVAWINTRENRRVFYTSLGGPEDFANPNFRALLLNGLLWTLGEFIPPQESAPAPDAQVEPPPARPSSGLQLGPLSPAESAQSFRVADDLVFEQVLAEPVVTQPVFLTFDERGRLWVVQYRQYPHPAGLKMVSRDNFWRAVYDKVPPPPPNHIKGADKITIHQDTNGDGAFDTHKTFVEGLNIVTSVAFGRGGVFVLNPPYLLRYPDQNQDDAPDGDPQVLLSGFGLEDTHSVANSLRWGPDGWLYGCQGSTVTGNILVHDPDGKPLPRPPVYSQGQNIWRYHPERRIYEIFSEGGGNAFGLEIDSAGRIFSGHNGGNTRGFHYMQGAYLQKGFDKHGPLSNPYAFGYFPQMPHANVDRFTHNFILYDSGALGERYQDRLFGIEPLQGRVVLSEITPDGSTFRTRDLGHPVTSDDKWFRPVDIKLGPDGAIYVADWYDRQVNHYRNHEGQMDAGNGRVYRLKAIGAKPVKPFDLARLSTRELLALATHPNRWHRQEALRLLGDRRDPSGLAEIAADLSNPSNPSPHESLWALNLSGGFDERQAAVALQHRSAQVRLWAVRLLGDERYAPPVPAQQLAALAAAEPNIEVRAQLASTAGRLPAGQSLPILRHLLARDEDASDPRQPLLLWWAMENQCASDAPAVLALMRDPALWQRRIMRETILSRLMRRFASAGRREDLLVCAQLFALSPGAGHTATLTRGFEEAFQGRPMTALPEELLTAMEQAGAESLVIGVRRQKPAALARALGLIGDPQADPDRRLQVIQALGEARHPAAPKVLLALAGSDDRIALRRAALGALLSYDDAEIPARVLEHLATYPALVRESAFGLLGTRAGWARAAVQAVDAGRLDQRLFPETVVRRLQTVLGEDEAAALIARHWPNVRQRTTAEMEAEIRRLGEVINLATGSPYAGKKLFNESCGVCHRLFGRGGEAGPDLTVYQRDDLPNLLLNIVNPGAEIREGYENFHLETRDGRELSGFIADQDTQVIVLRTPAGQSISLPRSEVLTIKPAGASLMPEGLLAGLSDQQVRDLFAYLRSTQPLNDGN